MSRLDSSLSPEEPAEIRELRALTARVYDVLRETAETDTGVRSGELRHLVGVHELVEQLARMEPTAERSVWVMQPLYFYDPEDPGVELTHSALARGVQTLLVTSPASLHVHPLLPSVFPSSRLAPVFLRAMVVDENRAIVGGEPSADGERTSWLTTRPAVVEAVLEVWHRTMVVSRPVLKPGMQPPLSRRQLQVARLLAVGEKDVSIARRLDMSHRTVEREVRALLEELRARNRTEAVLMMRGRGVNGGVGPIRPPAG